MYRREVFERAGGYRKECEFWEDSDLIVRTAAISKIIVLPYAIYKYRQSPVSTRVASDRDRVERAVDLMYRSRERIERNEGYDDLLETRSSDRRLDPRVFISVGSANLWAGGRPRLFRRLLRRGDLRFSLHTAYALAWTVWASLEPYSLRAFLRLLLLARNARASLLVRTNAPVTWPSEEIHAARRRGHRPGRIT